MEARPCRDSEATLRTSVSRATATGFEAGKRYNGHYAFKRLFRLPYGAQTRDRAVKSSVRAAGNLDQAGGSGGREKWTDSRNWGWVGCNVGGLVRARNVSGITLNFLGDAGTTFEMPRGSLPGSSSDLFFRAHAGNDLPLRRPNVPTRKPGPWPTANVAAHQKHPAEGMFAKA